MLPPAVRWVSHAGPAYALWTGIGATGTAVVVGMVTLGESVSAIKLMSIRLVLAGWRWPGWWG